jgi:hypothetical protein
MQMRIPILLAAVAAMIAAPVLVRTLAGDAPIPARLTAVVEDARTTLVTEIDLAPALRFERIDCTADGGYIVWFQGVGPFADGPAYVADSAGPYAVGRWGGGVADTIGSPTGFEHAPIVACA